MSTALLPDHRLSLEAALRSLASMLSDRPTQPMPRRKSKTEETFGRRLARIRKSRGITQPELAKKLAISNRMIAYYEAQTEHVPAHLLEPLTKALQVSTDELLGLKPIQTHEPPTNLRLWRRLRVVEQLPPADRRHILKQIETLARHAGIDLNGDDESS